MVSLTVRILGPVVVDRSAATCPLGPKPRLVLAVLAAHRGAVVSIDRLCDALWGDQQPASSRATLQSHVSRLRRVLEPEGSVVAVDHGYRLELPDGRLDVDHFARLAQLGRDTPDAADAARHYRSALEWWRGRAFGELADSEWLRAEAVRLDEVRLTLTEAWVECRLAAGGDPSLIGDLEAFTTGHPLRERFQRQRMVALFRDGRQAEALRGARLFSRYLREDMGLDPSSAFATVERQILANDPALLVVPADAYHRPPTRPLADDPTRLVGRAGDLARIADAVRRSPLVTLVGPGGVGKTRLARRVAVTASDFEEAAVFVELAAVTDPATVADAIATALDVQPRQHLTIEDALVVALTEREMLVVFDNCEHLLDVLVPLVDRLRRHCQRVHVLATSREPLGLPGEVVLPVTPLAVADVDADDPEEIAAAHAVQLLVDRVTAAVPSFTVTAANAGVIGEICRRLDGLPLAVELVAARFRSLDPETILQRLDEPSGMLGASMRSPDPRHRTLRDTVAWSFVLLSPDERGLFARLSAFAGSFDLAAVESVCAGRDIDPVEILAALVDKSMVQRVTPDGHRYQLLETLREYASERLGGGADAGDVAGAEDARCVHDAHVRWYTALAERASVGLTGPDEADWSHRVEEDFDNFRAAFGRAVRTGNADAALRLVAGLREFAFRRIRYELTVWAAAALEIPGAASHPTYAVVTAIVGFGHFVRGDVVTSVEVALQALDRQTEEHDSSGLAERVLGNALGYLGRTGEAIGWMDRQLVSARDGSPARLAHGLYMRSVAETSVGRTVRGAALAGEAQAAARASGSPTARAQAAYALGIALEGTEPDESLRLLSESARLGAGAGNRWIEAFAQTEVWWLKARHGDVLTALQGAGHVIDTWYRGGDWPNLQFSLRRVFGLFVQLGDHHAAAVLHGALDVSGAMSALPFEPRSAEDVAAAADKVRTGLGSEAFDEAMATGATLSAAATVAFVHECIAAHGR